MRDGNFIDFMKLYYYSLSATMRKLVIDPKVIFTYKDFQKELQNHGLLFLIYAPSTLQFVVADPEDLYDMEEYNNRRISKGEYLNLVKDFNQEKQAAE